jgi:predicted  nucleic acid-binding Zn-ribbon protein
MIENEITILKEEIADLKKEIVEIKKSQGEDIRRVARALKIFKQQRDLDYAAINKLVKEVYTSAYQRIAKWLPQLVPVTPTRRDHSA